MIDSSQKLEQGTRLRQARRAAGYQTATAATDRFGWKHSTYAAHENGQNGVPPGAAVRYGRAYKVDPGWILTGLGKGLAESDRPFEHPGVEDAQPTPPTIAEGYTPVGRYDASFSMGAGALAAQHPEPLGFWMLESQWLRQLSRAAPENLAVVKADGDSMLPTLAPGDWVLIDMTQTRLSREGIYAMRVADDVWIKRLSLNLREKTVRVISDNPSTPVQEIEDGELHVLGRVIAVVARKIA